MNHCADCAALVAAFNRYRRALKQGMAAVRVMGLGHPGFRAAKDQTGAAWGELKALAVQVEQGKADAAGGE